MLKLDFLHPENFKHHLLVPANSNGFMCNATQRPDSAILNGQIKNNINCRICGRADNVLSMIILDKTDAAGQIPEDAQGRFILHDGTMFQAYCFEDSSL